MKEPGAGASNVAMGPKKLVDRLDARMFHLLEGVKADPTKEPHDGATADLIYEAAERLRVVESANERLRKSVKYWRLKAKGGST